MHAASPAAAAGSTTFSFLPVQMLRPLSQYLPSPPVEWRLPKFISQTRNQNLDLPGDLLDFIWFTIGWAIIHWLLSKYVFQPLAERLVELTPSDTTSSESIGNHALSGGLNRDALEGSFSSTASKSAPKVRSRKPALNASTQQQQKCRTTTGRSSRGLSNKTPLPVADNRVKFHLSAYKLVTYGASTITGLYMLYHEDWMLHPDQYWLRIAQPGMMSDLVKFYYKLGFSSYLYASIHIFFEPRQKDFPIMVTHHIVTLALIFLSYFWPMYRVGCVILFLHDCSDPIMELAKMALYSGKSKAADGLFALFAAVFIYTRNWLFPVYIIRSCYDFTFGDPLNPPHLFNPARLSVYFLCILEAFHIYWASLIVKMAKKAIMDKGVSDDMRDKDQ
ncbi:TLC domain-containing protein [Phlyctochytrium arcticum]|nr:TLC domain-containing protein [Phlyctochytrium arcticum]